jgi:hypothetical protein
VFSDAKVVLPKHAGCLGELLVANNAENPIVPQLPSFFESALKDRKDPEDRGSGQRL